MLSVWCVALALTQVDVRPLAPVRFPTDASVPVDRDAGLTAAFDGVAFRVAWVDGRRRVGDVDIAEVWSWRVLDGGTPGPLVRGTPGVSLQNPKLVGLGDGGVFLLYEQHRSAGELVGLFEGQGRQSLTDAGLPGSADAVLLRDGGVAVGWRETAKLGWAWVGTGNIIPGPPVTGSFSSGPKLALSGNDLWFAASEAPNQGIVTGRLGVSTPAHSANGFVVAHLSGDAGVRRIVFLQDATLRVVGVPQWDAGPVLSAEQFATRIDDDGLVVFRSSNNWTGWVFGMTSPSQFTLEWPRQPLALTAHRSTGLAIEWWDTPTPGLVAVPFTIQPSVGVIPPVRGEGGPPVPLPPMRSPQRRPSVLWTGTHFLIAWDEQRFQAWQVRLATLDVDGGLSLVADPFTASSAPKDPKLLEAPDGGHYLATFGNDARLWRLTSPPVQVTSVSTLAEGAFGAVIGERTTLTWTRDGTFSNGSDTTHVPFDSRVAPTCVTFANRKFAFFTWENQGLVPRALTDESSIVSSTGSTVPGVFQQGSVCATSRPLPDGGTALIGVWASPSNGFVVETPDISALVTPSVRALPGVSSVRPIRIVRFGERYLVTGASVDGPRAWLCDLEDGGCTPVPGLGTDAGTDVNHVSAAVSSDHSVAAVVWQRFDGMSIGVEAQLIFRIQDGGTTLRDAGAEDGGAGGGSAGGSSAGGGEGGGAPVGGGVAGGAAMGGGEAAGGEAAGGGEPVGGGTAGAAGGTGATPDGGLEPLLLVPVPCGCTSVAGPWAFLLALSLLGSRRRSKARPRSGGNARPANPEAGG